jgi:hypothetical protein
MVNSRVERTSLLAGEFVMRHVSSGLVSLILVGFSIGAAAAQNVCVRAADGAVVCGPVTQDGAQSGAQGDKPNPNPFDQPPQPIAPPPTPALPPAAAFTVPNLAARQGERQRLARPATPARPAQVAHRPLPPRELERRPVRPAARDDLRRQAERGRMPPPRGAERGPPPRYAEIDRRRFDRPPPPQQRGERDMARRYDARVRELERELNALRADRGAAMRRGPGPGQQPMYRDRPPPPRYPNRDTRRDEGDRMAAAQRAHRRVEHDGYSDNN